MKEVLNTIMMIVGFILGCFALALFVAAGSFLGKEVLYSLGVL